MRIGAQFFTLREHCKDLDGLALSLRKVADIGYTTVQISGTCPFEADWLKTQLDANGLSCVITHTPAPRLLQETAKVAAEHDIFGCHYVGLGWYGFKEEKAEAGGTRYMLVEQDNCNGEDPFECLRRSYEYLKAQGFA